MASYHSLRMQHAQALPVRKPEHGPWSAAHSLGIFQPGPTAYEHHQSIRWRVAGCYDSSCGENLPLHVWQELRMPAVGSRFQQIQHSVRKELEERIREEFDVRY